MTLSLLTPLKLLLFILLLLLLLLHEIGKEHAQEQDCKLAQVQVNEYAEDKNDSSSLKVLVENSLLVIELLIGTGPVEFPESFVKTETPTDACVFKNKFFLAISALRTSPRS